MTAERVQRNSKQSGKAKHPHKSTAEPPHPRARSHRTERQAAAKKALARGPSRGRSAAGDTAAQKVQRGKSSSAEAGANETEEMDQSSEAEESDDDRETYVSTLLAIAQMDSEAAVAYETAAELVSSSDWRSQLQNFAGDHRRHIDDIGQLIEQVGGDAELAAPPPETSVFSMLSLAVASMGDRAALMALIGNEQFTNATYSTAIELVANNEALTLLQRNLEDEQRHLTWLSQQTSAPAEGMEEEEELEDAAEED